MKLYYKHIFSNKVSVVFVFIFFIYVIGLVYSASIYEGKAYLSLYLLENNLVFISDFVGFTKIFTIVLNLFLVLLLYQKNSLNLTKYLIDKQRMKLKVVISRLLISLIICFVIVGLCFSFYTIMIVFLTPYEFTSFVLIELFLGFIVLNVFYLLLTHLFLSILPNLLTAFISILLFWYMEVNQSVIFANQNNLHRFLYNSVPNISLILGEFQLTGDAFLHIIVFLILILFITFINIKKDVL